MSRQDVDVLIVGAGLAGLSCAIELSCAGRSVLVLEASEDVGGRVRTDAVDGFRLDRGFQVLLTAYPTTRSLLDYEAIDLRPFEPGALVRCEGAFHRVTDPFRRPASTLATLRAPVGSLADKRRVARLALQLRSTSVEEILGRTEDTTISRLRAYGFSDRMIARFFRPFLGGVFLDPELETSSRMFEFVFKMFGSGPVAVPAEGMGALPRQLAGMLPQDAIRLSAPVADVSADSATLESGERMSARAVVVAADPASSRRLAAIDDVPAYRPALCWYFDAPESPVDEGILVLDGEGKGPVTNLAVMSDVSATYAPSGRHLVSATILGEAEPDRELLAALRSQMRDWFGARADDWREIRPYRIPAALPNQAPAAGGVRRRPVSTAGGVFVCGDHRVHGSIEGALQSGQVTARQVVASLDGAA